MEEPIIIDNDSWYTTKEVVQQEGTTDTGSAMTLWSAENGCGNKPRDDTSERYGGVTGGSH